MLQNTKHAFTLVELIVVIVILGILGTIGFVSYSGYLGGARDSNRIAQLQGINASLNLYSTKRTLPLPDDYVTVTASGTTMGYQGYAGTDILELINYTNGGTDPKDGTYFTYYLSKDRKHIQLLTFLEEAGGLQSYIPFVPQSYAADLTKRFPKVFGKKLGVLTQETTNIPIQEIASIISAGALDVVLTSDSYNAHLTDTDAVSGTGGVLVSGIASVMAGQEYKDCKSLLSEKSYTQYVDGIYYINPTGSNSFQVYCDMTTDGGGWTFFGHMNANSSGKEFFGTGTGTYKPSRIDDGTKYSLGVEDFSHTEMMVTLDQTDPIVADAVNKIIFYNYSKGHLGFNKGPIPCQGIASNYSYKTQIGGGYVSGTTSGCSSAVWYTRSTGNIAYLSLFNISFYGNVWGTGMGGNDTRFHDGWWYIR